jgi:hypothetical protein
LEVPVLWYILASCGTVNGSVAKLDIKRTDNLIRRVLTTSIPTSPYFTVLLQKGITSSIHSGEGSPVFHVVLKLALSLSFLPILSKLCSVNERDAIISIESNRVC